MKDWDKKHEKIHLVDIATIKDLEDKVKANAELAKKWLTKVLYFHECLEILHDMCQEHTFQCKVWYTIYSQYKKNFPPPVSLEGDAAKVQTKVEEVVDFGDDICGDARKKFGPCVPYGVAFC